jgi:hypothetical protein
MEHILKQIYFKIFQLNEREERLRQNNTWTDDENGRNSNIRNDQSISECMKFRKTLEDLEKIVIREIKLS